MFTGSLTVVGLLLGVLLCREGVRVEGLQNETSTPANEQRRVLSRQRRFLLFPPGANFIVTISGGKGSMFATPRGYNLVAEMDMYHPLPDYMYHATSLRLGTVAMYPSETTTTPKPTGSPGPHHEPSVHEVEQYLVKHPDTWTPPSWSKDRSDWTPVSYSDNAPQKSPQPAAAQQWWKSKLTDRSDWTPVRDSVNASQKSPPPVAYQWWKNRLWETTGNDRLYYHNPSVRRVRALGEGGAQVEPAADEQLSFWAAEDRLNISQHRGWEHFHHYRDRRSLYDHLETTIPSFFGFHMKECLLRSICEARNLLPPKGRSMTVDILRVIFTYPLKDELSDDYSRMMREATPNCRDLFFERCPLSILQLLLFGKFEL